MEWLLRRALASFVRRGTLRVTTAGHRRFTVGDGTGTPVAVRFASRRAEWGVLLDPDLKLGKAFMNGTFIVEEGSIGDVLALVMSQDWAREPTPWAWPQWAARYVLRRLNQLNRRRKAQQNVAHHYDLDGPLYSLFLDADRQYSCAYFETPNQTLDDAQLAKKRHLAAKLLIERGNRVLDVGSGWGGLGCYLAETCGGQVHGVTLSQQQLDYSVIRAQDRGVAGRVIFGLADYRDVTGSSIALCRSACSSTSA